MGPLNWIDMLNMLYALAGEWRRPHRQDRHSHAEANGYTIILRQSWYIIWSLLLSSLSIITDRQRWQASCSERESVCREYKTLHNYKHRSCKVSSREFRFLSTKYIMGQARSFQIRIQLQVFFCLCVNRFVSLLHVYCLKIPIKTCSFEYF